MSSAASLICIGCGRPTPNEEGWPSEHFSTVCAQCGPFVRPGMYDGEALEFWRQVTGRLYDVRRALPLPTSAEVRVRAHPVTVRWLRVHDTDGLTYAPEPEGGKPLLRWYGAVLIEDPKLEPREVWIEVPG